MAARDDLLNDGGIESRLSLGGGDGGRSGVSLAGVAASPSLVGSSAPTQRFDISVLGGLRPSDKYLGKNRVSDIKEAYDTYLTGSPVGRGGQYAVDAARRYGTTLTEAARGYLVGVGLPTLADIIPTPTPTPTPTPAPTPAPKKEPIELLLDALPRLFGNAIQSQPLQSQAYGYTPVSGDFGASGGASGGGIGMWLLLGGAAIAIYFIYKRYSG